MLYDKLKKMILVAGMISLIMLVLIVANSSNDVIDGFGATVLGICVVIICLVAVFITISAILAIIEGLKKEKIAYIKKFLVTVVSVATAYGLDYFREADVYKEFELGKFLFRIFVSTIAIIGGKYIFTDHKKEAENELHF